MCKIEIPLSVNSKYRGEYYRNFRLATKKSGNLMLFAADQKIEHLNDDFVGPTTHQDDSQPEHLFHIADQAKVGVMACHLGLLAKYGHFYRSIPYLIKLNGKTNLVPTKQQEPISKVLHTVEQVVDFAKNSRLKIVGIGYTIYLGSEHEAEMLAEAARVVYQAQRHGLLSVLWIYPRGQAVSNEHDPHLIAGAVGVAACLGADFVKVTYPSKASKAELKNIIKAAGKTGVIFSGGSSQEPKDFLKTLRQQIDLGARGSATGRNIHQRSLPNAIRMAQAITAIAVYNYNCQAATDIYLGKTKFSK